MCRNIFCFLFLTFLCFLSEWVRAQNGLALSEAHNFYNCNTSNSAFTVKVTNESDQSLFREGTYQIDWGDHSAPLTNLTYIAVSAATHRYESYGDFVLIFSAESVSGGRKSWTQTIHNLGNPVFNFATEQIYTPCVSSEMEIHLVDYENNSSQTVYEIDYGDEKGKDKYTQQDLIDRHGTFRHVYKGSSCPDDLGFNLRVVAKYENGCLGNMGRSQTCKVVIPPIADFGFDERVCINTSIGLENKTVPGLDEVCTPNYTSEWYIDDATVPIEEQAPDISFSTPGRHKIKLVVYNGTADCARSVMEKEIPIYDEVRADFRISNDTVCVNTPVELTGLISGDTLGAGWVIVSPNGGIDTIKGINVRKSFDQCGAYGIQFYAQGYCVRKSRDTALVVMQDPEVSILPLDTLCPGEVLDINRDVVNYSLNCNAADVRWEMFYPDGSRETSAASYPRFTLDKSGKYTLNARLKGAKCPAEYIEATQSYFVHDTTFVRDIRPSAHTICVGETVEFESHSSAHNLTYDWKPQIGSRINFVLPTNGHSASPVLRFDQPGTFVVAANLKAVCNQVWDPLFEVKAVANPAVKLKFDSKICPQVIDLSADQRYIEYDWKENPPRASWKIEPDDGGCEIIGDANTVYPKIRFQAPKEYKITVTLDSLGCPAGERPSASQIVEIYDDAKELFISASDTSVCVGEEVVLSNTSTASASASEITKYHWEIDPWTAIQVNQGDTNQRTMVIEFAEDGVYEVRGSVESCGQLDSVMRIHVKRNPEVVFDLPDTLCPGAYNMCDYAGYTWYRNLHEVKWEMEGGCRFAPGYAETDTCPSLILPPGEQHIVITLQDVALCSGLDDRTQVSEKVYVRDSFLNIAISPSATDLCLKDTLRFTNHTTGGEPGIRYHWQGMEEDIRFLDGTEVAEPRVVFLSTGTYHIGVTVTAAGGCNTQYRNYEVIVRDVPVVDFKVLEDICFGTVLEIDTERIRYEANNCDLTYAWSVSPQERNVIEQADGPHPKVHFSRPGHYTMTVTVSGQCGRAVPYSKPVRVLDNHLSVQFAPSAQEGCTPLSVDFENQSVGDTLTYTWKILPVKKRVYVNSDSMSPGPSVRFDSAGNYRVRLIARNLCRTDSTEVSIRAYSPPVILPELLRVENVCERDYLFDGDAMLEVNDMNDSIVRVEWTIDPPAGVRFENHTDENSIYPDLRFTAGIYHLTGKYWNQCDNSGEVEVYVNVDTLIPVVLTYAGKDTSVCAKTDAFRLRAQPEPGLWTSADGMVQARADGYYFDPYIDVDKDYPVVYVYQHKSCIDKDTLNVHTIALPVVNAGEDQEICINNAPRILRPVEPVSGGWWEGQGITGTDKNVFTPDVTGPRVLYYYFTDSVTRCTNQDEILMTVWGLPDTTFYADKQYCIFTDALFRPEEKGVGNRFHWEFGDDSVAVSLGDTVHRYEQPGFRDVRLITESVHHCLDTSAYKTVEIVNIPPDADFTLSDTVGCGPFRLMIAVDTARYQDPHLLFDWNFGNGILSDSLVPPNLLEYQAGVWDTVYTIRFDVYNRVCAYHKPLQREITVYSSPAAGFVKQHEWECAPIEVRFHNTSTGNRNRYEWHYGDDSVSYQKEGAHLFKGDTLSRTYNITLIAVNNCGRDTFTDPFVVKPQSVHAFFTTPERNICVGEEICFVNETTEDLAYMINKQWDFGDHSKDTTWDACHSYTQSGIFKVHLYVDNGCGFDTISDYVRIYPLPSLEIRSEDELCENDTFHFELKSDLPLQRQEWDFGDSVISLYSEDIHRYEGHGLRLVKVWGLSASPAVCRGETQKEIRIHPAPVIAISPLDTAACSPLFYRPSVEGVGHLMWDYGDGTELTSDQEHEYVNSTDEVNHHVLHVYAESDKGCRSEYKGEVIVYNVPRAGIGKEVIKAGKPQVVEFINLSEMYDECVWYLPFDKVVHAFENQQVSFEETELYTASVVVANRYGCRDSAAIEHQVVMKGLFFPNSFIPSSGDPRVSRFNGTGIGLKKYHLVIYDQYNNKVWETTAIENGHPSEGWDGRNKKGEMLPQGVYIWRAQATFIDEAEWTGKNNDSGATQTIQGVVLMLKNN